MRTPKRIFLLITAAVLALVFAGCAKTGGDHASGQKYHCPMHPTYVSDRLGDCPICNMKLVPIKDAAPAAKTPAQSSVYTCSMCPQVRSDKPGLCPECNMKLTPAPAAGPDVPGRTAIMLSSEKQQLIGLTTETVTKRVLTQMVRATATLEHDETRYARIAPRFGGWIRELRVNATGQEVAAGAILFTVYSPELLAAQNEYLLAHRQLASFAGPADDPQRDATKQLAETARRRLALWQVADEEIAALERAGRAFDELPMRSPVAGHIVAKTAVAGKAFMAGETLYEIAALDPLWVRAAVPESDSARIAVGQKARVVFPALAGQVRESTVAFIYPHIEAQSRRAELRLVLANPEHTLRPSMWAQVEIEVALGEKLTVPAAAVIDTGTRFVAFVPRADGHFEPREVRIGAKTDDHYEVLGGLADGEKVVARALFLVDSESQLKAAIAGMSAPGGHNH
ncbi:MAG: efflux RND transporter periplasmic adaptor subunit [Opitutae bacterium]|nr:efflux RND transporter periplasmic adaptor subunit [Opitutae bacterium]